MRDVFVGTVGIGSVPAEVQAEDMASFHLTLSDGSKRRVAKGNDMEWVSPNPVRCTRVSGMIVSVDGPNGSAYVVHQLGTVDGYMTVVKKSGSERTVMHGSYSECVKQAYRWVR